MERVEAIRNNPLFRASMERIERAEAEREFCRHGMSHVLDVARIAWITALERRCRVPKDVVYAAALLHDVGRAEQYATGEDHDVAGARIAGEILKGLPASLQFDAAERSAILAAVAGHRGPAVPEAHGRAPGGELAGAVRGSGEADAGVAARAPEGSPPDSSAQGLGEVLARLVKEADNRSRACYACPARDACYWPDERKNLSLDI